MNSISFGEGTITEVHKRYTIGNQVFGHFRLDNCAREISLTRLIPRVNPSHGARGAYRCYVAANYGYRYHPDEPPGEREVLGRPSARLITNCGRRYSRFLSLVRDEMSITHSPVTFPFSSIHVQSLFVTPKGFSSEHDTWQLSPIRPKFHFLCLPFPRLSNTLG